MGDETTGGLSMEKPHEVIRWVRTNCQWAMREKMAYLMLYSRRSSDRPEPYPSVRTLADDMGTTKDAATEAVHRLQELGALEIVDGGGRNGGNSYRLLPPWDAQQAVAKKPRGRHARPAEEQSSNSGQSLKQGQSSNQGLSLIQAQLSLKQGHEQSLKQGHIEPIDRANERSQCLPQSDKPPDKPAKRHKSEQPEKAPTEKELLASDANFIAKVYDDLAKQTGVAPVADWREANGVVQKQLKKAGAPRISRDEAEQAVRWAFQNRRSQVSKKGLTGIREFWSWWLDVKNKTGRSWGNTYQSNGSFQPTGNDPMVLPKGGQVQ